MPSWLSTLTRKVRRKSPRATSPNRLSNRSPNRGSSPRTVTRRPSNLSRSRSYIQPFHANYTPRELMYLAQTMYAPRRNTPVFPSRTNNARTRAAANARRAANNARRAANNARLMPKKTNASRRRVNYVPVYAPLRRR